METLIVAVGLYLVYVVLDKFNPAIEGITELANGKVVMEKQNQNFKNAKKRAKLADKVLEDDMTIISDKDLDRLLAGKVKDEKKK